MRGMVLAAGRGERMRPLSYRLAKPAIPVLNRPLVSYALRTLQRAGVRRAAVNLHHLPDTLEPVVRACTPKGMEVDLFREERLLGTAGGARNAATVLRGGPFFLTNGDFVLDVDPSETLAVHKRMGAVATMVLVPYEDQLGYSPVEVADDRVVRIAGRPESNALVGERHIFAGLHVVEPEILDRIPPGEEVDINREIYPALIAEGKTIAAHVVAGPWLEFGTPGEYLRRTLHLLSPEFRPFVEKLGFQVSGEGGDPVLVADGARISDNVTLHAGVVLGEGCSVGREVKLRRTVVWSGAILGYNTDVSDSIIGDGVILPPNSRFHHKTVLARAEDIPPEAGGERQGDLVFFRL